MGANRHNIILVTYIVKSADLFRHPPLPIALDSTFRYLYLRLNVVLASLYLFIS